MAASLRRSAPAMAMVTAILAACAGERAVPPPGVPDVLRVSESQALVRMLHGSGVQIYECVPGAEMPARYAWVLQAPAADLSDRSGKDAGKHYAGPTWESNDGSKVVGEVVARDNGPVPSAIPWLLLRAKSTSGKGIFAKIQFIQRLHTVGGQAPESGCNASHAGQRARVAYSADYYFYGARR